MDFEKSETLENFLRDCSLQDLSNLIYSSRNCNRIYTAQEREQGLREKENAKELEEHLKYFALLKEKYENEIKRCASFMNRDFHIKLKIRFIDEALKHKDDKNEKNLIVLRFAKDLIESQMINVITNQFAFGDLAQLNSVTKNFKWEFVQWGDYRVDLNVNFIWAWRRNCIYKANNNFYIYTRQKIEIKKCHIKDAKESRWSVMFSLKHPFQIDGSYSVAFPKNIDNYVFIRDNIAFNHIYNKWNHIQSRMKYVYRKTLEYYSLQMAKR